MKKITHLRRIGMTARDPAELGAFFEQVWGLKKVAEQDGAMYLRGTGEEHHIVAVSPGDRARITFISLGLPDRDAVDEAARELSQRRNIVVVQPPAPLNEPGGGYGFRIKDVDGRAIELSADVAPADQDEYDAVIRPTRLSHIVLNSAQVDAYSELICDVLGFRLSDENAHMRFFRCNPNHHSVALAQAPFASLNHVAFELPRLEDVLRGIQHMEEQGYATLWGPGRHGPGDNVFGYFRAPNGHVVEYTAELQQIENEDDYVPRFWRPEDYRVRDAWASPESLRPGPEAREAMLGEPENAAA